MRVGRIEARQCIGLLLLIIVTYDVLRRCGFDEGTHPMFGIRVRAFPLGRRQHWHRTSYSYHRNVDIVAIRSGRHQVGSLTRFQPLRISRKDFKDSLEEVSYVAPDYLMDIVSKFPMKRLTVADVSAASGLKLQAVEKDLLALAAAVGAVLEVTNDGDIVYSFPADSQRRLLQRSIAARGQQLAGRVLPPLYYVFKASFGVVLILSIAAAATAIIVVSADGGSSSDGDSSDRRSSGRSSSSSRNVSLNFLINLSDVTDLLTYQRFDQYRLMATTPGGYRPKSFLQAVFSYLFGDGNPNAGHEEALAALAAQMIRKNAGRVVAEQLAPFIAEPPPLPASSEQFNVAESTVVDEAFVLPLVLKFGGSPTVSEDGDIVYEFEDLTLTAGSDSDASPPLTIVPLLNGNETPAQLAAILPQLEEQEIPFSSASAAQRATAAALGVLNVALVGALGSGTALSRMAISGSPFLVGIAKLYPGLLGYAVLFNLIPLMRSFQNRRDNDQVKSRNERRRGWLRRLSNDSDIKRKLKSKDQRNIGKQKSTVRDEDISFNSRSSLDD